MAYRTWPRAMQTVIKPLLAEQSVSADAIPDKTTLVDVLNAAWHARITSSPSWTEWFQRRPGCPTS